MSNSLLTLTAISQLITLIIVFTVYRRRKEVGFLFVAIGLTVQLTSTAIFLAGVLLRLVGIVYMIPPQVMISFVATFSLITSVLSLIGWLLLVKGEAPKA